MSDVSQKLDAIRKKFVGSGEEHDLLGRLTTEYRQAYDEGYKQAESECQGRQTCDANSLKFAHAICDLSQFWSDLKMTGSEGGDDEYYLKRAGRFLAGLGLTSEVVRGIADEMEIKVLT